MPYATQADLIARFGTEELVQLTDRSNAGAIDAAVVATALADADGIINPYLAGRYAVPVSPVPSMLTQVASDLARFRLWKDRPTERVRTAYEDAIKLLEALSKGMAVLPGAAAATDSSNPAAPTGQVRIAADARQLTRAGLADFLG